MTRTWSMRYYMKKGLRQRKLPSVFDDAVSTSGAQAALANLFANPEVIKIEFVASDCENDKKAGSTPVKAAVIKWHLEMHPKGELWCGYIGDRLVADVFHNTAHDTKPRFSLYLGSTDEQIIYADVTSIESGKRAAQRKLHEVVQFLVTGQDK